MLSWVTEKRPINFKMTPKEKVDKEYWELLKKIKEEFLRTKIGESVRYWVYPGFVGGGYSATNEIKILEKLEELKTIKILNPGGTGEYEI